MNHLPDVLSIVLVSMSSNVGIYVEDTTLESDSVIESALRNVGNETESGYLLFNVRRTMSIFLISCFK